MSKVPLVSRAVGTATVLIGLFTSVTVKVPVTRVAEIDVTVKLPCPPSWPLSQFCAPSTIVAVPRMPAVKSSGIVGAADGGTSNPALKGTTNVITRKFVSWPVIVRRLLVSVARRDSELVQGAPSTSTLIVLPLLGVGDGAGTDVSVTSKAPSAIVRVPVAPVPGTAASVNVNVPEARVDVSVLMVMLP